MIATRRTLVDDPQPFTSEELLNIQLAMGSFTAFLYSIFPSSFETQTFPMADGQRHAFSLSDIHFFWGTIIQRETRACLIAPRMHLKSTVCNNAFSFWQGFKSRSFVDGVVFSYTDPLASDHVTNLKRQIKGNPYCRFWSDNNQMAKSVVDFNVSFGPQLEHLGSWQFYVEPAGIFAAKRGKHPRFVVCLTPDTKVRVGGRARPDEGYRRIDRVRVGDEVITHRGRLRRVTDVMSREVDEELYVVVTERGDIQLTGNHRLLTKRGWVRAEQLGVGDVLLAANGRNGVGLRGEKNGRWKGGQVEVKCQRSGCDGTRRVTPAKVATAKYCSHSCRQRDALGERNSNWNGGSSTVPRSAGSDFTEELRERVRDLYGRRCVLDGRPETVEKRLDVHHIDRDRWNNSVENLIALCRPCHMRTNIRTDFDEQLRELVGVHNGIPVLDIRKERYRGRVWNLEVDEDHSYALESGVAHNCDDILSDFANPLDMKTLRRIDDIFNQVIQSLPAPDDPLIVVGTPQSYDDTLYKLRDNEEFWWGRFPSETVEAGREEPTVAWPERFSYRVLRRVKRRVKMKAYQVEYLLIPFLAVNSRLPREVVEACVEPDLKPCSLMEPFYNPDNLPTFGGMDIGKEVHPTHVVVYMKMHDGSLVQVYEKFLDHMPYNAQAKLVNEIIRHFDISRFYYDSTRAELDDRQVSRRAHGRKFTVTLKANIALLLERRVYADQDEPTIVLLPDLRQVNQICAVTMDLKSVETDEGHGDSFWSNALAVKAAEDGAGFSVLGDLGQMFSQSAQRGYHRQAPAVPKGLQQ